MKRISSNEETAWREIKAMDVLLDIELFCTLCATDIGYRNYNSYIKQAWELRMDKSAEKWGSGGRRRPPVGVQVAMPPEAEAF